MKTILTIILIGFLSTIFSQTDYFKDRNADLEIGMNSNFNLSTLELGLNLKKDYSPWGLISDAIILGSEFGTKDNQFLFVPKLTYSYNFVLINGSFSILNYNYLQNHSIYLKPQLGVTLLGLIDLVYGYNFPLSNINHEFKGNTITLRFKLKESKDIITNGFSK
jgi:hypothetical protein